MIYDYKVTTGNGEELSLSDFKGKVILVVNTATGCGFTPQYKPIEDLYENYHDKGLEIVGISFDREKEPWLAAIKEWKMPWIHLYGIQNGKSVAAEIYGVTGIPDNVLVDPEGTVVARGLRGQDLADRISKIFE